MPPTPGNLIGQSPNGIVSVQIGAGLALSAGTLSVSGGGTGGTPTIVGGGIVSVSSRSNSFTISATGGGASGNFAYQSAVGNTTGATSSQTRLLTLESYRFAGGVSGGFSAGSLVISGVTTAASGTLQNRFALGNTTSATSSFAGTLSILSVSGAGLASAGFDTNGVLVISATSGTVRWVPAF